MSELERADRRITYQPALDGVRAVAVVLVLLYHQHALDARWFGRGGFIGVDIFFVLSGFLITALLVAEHRNRGSIALGAFWGRRLRRLVPALLVLLVLVALLSRFAYSDATRALVRDDVPWVLTYLENWHLALGRGSILSPLSHTWSLAVEEQWYLIWPLVLGLILSVARGRARVALGVIVALAVGSLVWGWYVFDRFGLARAYFGTDVRAQELLAGAALGVIGVRGLHRVWDRAGRWIDGAAVVGLLALVGIGLVVRDGAKWFPAGRFALAGVTLIVIAAAVAPRGKVRTVLALAPLVLVGRISYGLYLFHFPVFGWLGPRRVGFDGLPLLLVQLAVTAAIAVGSYLLVERPIREGRVRSAVWLPIGAAVVVAVVATTSIGVVTPPHPSSNLLAYVLSKAAAETPPGEARVLVVGGSRAVALNLETGGPYDGDGIRGLAVGTFGCAFTDRTPKCRTVIDDVAGMATTFRARAVVLMPDTSDLAAVARPGGTRALRTRLDELRPEVGRRTLVVLDVACVPPGMEQAHARFVAVISAWAARHHVRTGRPSTLICAAGGADAPPAEVWRPIAALVRGPDPS